MSTRRPKAKPQATLAATLVLAFALVSTGCAASEAEPVARAGDVSRPSPFLTVKDLTSASDAVVVAVPNGEVRRDKIADLDVLVSSVTVVSMVVGGQNEKNESTFWVKQPLVQPDDATEDILLQKGRPYVLFLDHFELQPGKPEGSDYVVVGFTTGLFAFESDTKTPTDDSLVHSLDGEAARTELASIRLGDLVEQVRASS